MVSGSTVRQLGESGNPVAPGDMTGLEFPEAERTLLERLSLFYLQSRYPPEIEALAKTIKRAMTADYLRQTEAAWKRLRREICPAAKRCFQGGGHYEDRVLA